MGTQRKAIVVGAGVAGLACAGELVRRDGALEVLVLEKSRGLGGRAATRRIEGQAVDHGVAFYHGSDPDFLAALEQAGPGLAGWPQRVQGAGRPCQLRAFRPGESRRAFAEGATAFPKSLARGLDVRRETTVAALRAGGETIQVGATGAAHDVVLALPAPQAAELLAPLTEVSGELAAFSYLLAACAMQPCLTAIAGYPAGGAAPPWDLCHPEDSEVLQTVSHDSTKRSDPKWTVLVLQAHPAWSSRNWDLGSAGLLAEAARLLGDWAARPTWSVMHRWRFARAAGGAELAGPAVVRLPGGARIGLAGEIFSRRGGIEGAWRSGVELARRLVEER